MPTKHSTFWIYENTYTKINTMKVKASALLLTMSLILTVSGYSQNTKPNQQETQKWLNEKINGYSYDSEDAKYNYTIDFSKGIMTVRDKNTFTSPFRTHDNTYTCNLADIDFFTFKEKPYNIWLTFKMKEGKYETRIMDGEKFQSFGEINILLSKSIKNDNLMERIRKALNRIFELNGIEAKSNEAF